jgi:hypothetical protein
MSRVLGIANLDAVLVGARVERTLDLQANSAICGSAPPVSAPSEGAFLDAKRGSELAAI